ncbi:FliM/FliN family flagellar motor switch protein [Dyella ginsengisoli]|uniref:FliM/FliN family flagellar motor switch protein n=1 Tax=Dyella ginsengisoli TaxID=363848 RepID=UPI00037B6EB8|nr:FliM/FliN family flagellar motor switch protein [Dyella ginsengisoli]
MSPQFGWIGTTRSQAVESLLRRVLKEWHADWSVHPSESIDIETAEERAPFQGGGLALHSKQGEETVLIALAQVDLNCFGAWLAGLPEAPHALAEEVGDSALRDFAGRVGACMSGQVVLAETGKVGWPATATHTQLGALLFRVRVGKFRLPLAVTRIGVDRLAPPEHRAGPMPDNWASRQHALEDTPLTVEAVLSMGRISLREINSLSPGEVLIGECSVSSKAKLRIKGGTRVLASGVPVRRGQLRAITLTSEPSKQELP